MLCLFLQLLQQKGVCLEEAIFDRQNQRFCVTRSDYYWLTILRKLYKFVQEKDETPGLLEFTSFLEETLYQKSEKFGIIPRSAKLYLGVEQRNHDLVSKLLKNNSDKTQPFLQNTITGPWEIFPFRSSYHHLIRATPLGREVPTVQISISFFSFQ